MNIADDKLAKMRDLLSVLSNNVDDVIDLVSDFDYPGYRADPDLDRAELIIQQIVEQKAHYDDVAIALFIVSDHLIFTCSNIDGIPVMIGRTPSGRKIYTQHGSFIPPFKYTRLLPGY
jgi:hypothetical protein